ncbi:MAG: hypothetical protein ABR878_15405 [Roseiarcus sp.]|jgi:hypothetical protein
MKKAESLRYTGLSFAAMAGVSVAALLIPAQSYADSADALICRPIPPMAGAILAPDAYGRCPPSYVLVEEENPTAIATSNSPTGGDGGNNPTGSDDSTLSTPPSTPSHGHHGHHGHGK